MTGGRENCLMADELEEQEKPEESAALELAGTATVPEELPKWADVDHSKLYVWVADSNNDRIQKFDGNGKFLFQFGKSAGTRAPYLPGEFKGPFGVSVDKEGDIWVADTGCHRIQKFDPDLNFVSKWGTVGNVAKQFKNPSGIGLSWEPDWAPTDE